MKIDKSKLKIGLWYEDGNGNVIPHDINCVDPPDEAVTYHTCWPLRLTEDVWAYYTNKDICRHPLKYRERTFGWVKGIKGCRCKGCGKEKIGKKYIPFFLMKWQTGSSSYELFSGHTHIGSGSQDCIVAMVNSGDYTLEEAIVAFGNACERCMNVLLYKYLDGKEGYPEYSEEWKKCGTVCEWCKDESTDRG